MKSLNISKEVKGMRQTIDLHLYNAEDLEDSHSSYLSELKRNKKGSLDEFISTSVKYAIKQARSIQLNEELKDIKNTRPEDGIGDGITNAID